jgi:hypothetical protein
MYNPVRMVSGGRRRSVGARHGHIGGEFYTCWDGSQVKNDAAGRALCPPQPGGGTPPPTSGWGDPGAGTPPGGATGGGTPYTPPYTPPGGSTGGGTPWNPPVSIPTPGNPMGCCPAVPVCPENLKRYWMPFNPGAGYTVAVAAGATAVFIGEPQKPFKGDRLIIGSGITPYFDVIALEIANIPQSLGSGAVPADMFSEVSTYTEMTFDPAGPGIKIVLTVKNKSSVSQNFQASLTGIAIG